MSDIWARGMTELNETGDTTIVWDEDTDEKMLGIIKRKMDEGFVFYIVKQTPVIKINRTVKARSIEEIRNAGSVIVKDEALEKLFLEGSISTARVPANDHIDTVRKAMNSRDVATNYSVAVRPARGG